MSIFNIEKNSMFLSNDWQLFQKFMGNVGAFTYIAKEKSAYFDPVALKILNCSREKINEYEFFNLLDRISKNPVKDEKHIYAYCISNTTYYIKMNIFENKDVWLGFVQDFTRQMSEKHTKYNSADYDPITRLPSYQHFNKILKDKLQTAKQCWLAIIHLNGIDKLRTFLTVDNINNCITSVSETIKVFSSNDIIFGSKSYYEIYALFNNLSKNEVYSILKNINDAVKHCIITDDFGEVIDIGNRNILNISVGCCSYPEQAYEYNMLINYAEFALFEAKNSKKKNVVNWFCEERYRLEKSSYKNAQLFSKLMRENQLKYHFQPIVNAIDGEIYAYEALMRTSDDVNLSPTQLLSIAQEQNNLYAIEKSTFFNSIRILSENQELFKNKKLFINSISGSILTEEDFNKLYLKYGELMEKLVIEITEHNNTTANELNLLKRRCVITHSGLAIDDYGTGYANSANLLNYTPEYIKIDRSLISDIQNNLKKQQLVSSIIDFAHNNNIFALAEGVETSSEMKTLIRMGIDLIQGFYTSTPKSELIESIPENIRDEIINTNLETTKNGIKKIFAARNCSDIDLLKLALEKYTDIHIYQSKLTIKGDIDKLVKMNITIMDNYSCELTLQNVNLISSSSKPTIMIGESAQLFLNIKGENKINYSGIYVPKSSQIFINGDGNLLIDCRTSSGFALGNDLEHPYGDIFIDMDGSLKIIGNNEETVCIGGGYNSESEINLKSGNIIIDMHSYNGVAIGTYNGGSIINIKDKCKLDINVSGTKVIAIGSLKSNTDITSSAEINICARGTSAIGIGSFEESDIKIRGGKLSLKMRSSQNTAIGSFNGVSNINIKNSVINIDDEGSKVSGIGDIYGDGYVSVTDSDLNMRILATEFKDIGSENGKIKLNNNNIKSFVNEKEIIHNDWED